MASKPPEIPPEMPADPPPGADTPGHPVAPDQPVSDPGTDPWTEGP